MRKILRNLKILALILLTSTILLTASSSGAKAASTTSVYVYATFGGSISANGTALTMGGSPTYPTGDTLSLTATASSGFKFLCFDYVASTGPATSTNNPFLQTLSTSSCAIEALFTPTTNTTVAVSGSGKATVTTLITAGGNSEPVVGVYSNYTVGSAYPFSTWSGVKGTAGTAGTGFKFLYWLTDTTVGSTSTYTIYTSSSENIKLASASVVIQPMFVASSSSVTLPTIISEYSNAVVAILAIALVLSALGAYAYTKKAKK